MWYSILLIGNWFVLQFAILQCILDVLHFLDVKESRITVLAAGVDRHHHRGTFNHRSVLFDKSFLIKY
jgi:hypothetical protein